MDAVTIAFLLVAVPDEAIGPELSVDGEAPRTTRWTLYRLHLPADEGATT